MKRQRRACPGAYSSTGKLEDCIMSTAATLQHQQPYQQQLQDRSQTERRRKHGYCEVEPKYDVDALHAYSQHQKRYNNERPNYLQHIRVPERLYPDPSKFGWHFTGSSEKDKANFYEKESEYGHVLLNFYFTSGTIKVTLMHTVNGEVQLFKKGRSLLPDIYRNVLEDPIMNTDRPYRRSGTDFIQM